MNTFTAIDFELANANYNSVCAVGIVNVREGVVVNEFHSLVQPPGNKYMWQTTRVHGIKPKDTASAPTFEELFQTIRPLIEGQSMVAHNEKFDRSVLAQTVQFYKIEAPELKLQEPWICTSVLYQKLGFTRTKLSICCQIMGVPLNHHDPLSDARAAAMLYLQRESAPTLLEQFELAKSE